jgi:hypothetical protein
MYTSIHCKFVYCLLNLLKLYLRGSGVTELRWNITCCHFVKGTTNLNMNILLLWEYVFHSPTLEPPCIIFSATERYTNGSKLNWHSLKEFGEWRSWLENYKYLFMLWSSVRNILRKYESCDVRKVPVCDHLFVETYGSKRGWSPRIRELR